MLNLHNVAFVRSAVKTGDFPNDALPQIAFAGKSNVGKSSTINRLLNRKNFARVGNEPGKTVHINFFQIDEKVYFVDLPGYGYAKVSKKERARWGKLMDEYFASEDTLTLGFQIVDIRHKLFHNHLQFIPIAVYADVFRVIQSCFNKGCMVQNFITYCLYFLMNRAF